MLSEQEEFIADLRARLSHAEAERDEERARVTRLDRDYQQLAEESRQDAAHIADLEARLRAIRSQP